MSLLLLQYPVSPRNTLYVHFHSFFSPWFIPLAGPRENPSPTGSVVFDVPDPDGWNPEDGDTYVEQRVGGPGSSRRSGKFNIIM